MNNLDDIRSLLSYDCNTGLLTWIKGRRGSKGTGKVAGSSNGKYIRVIIDGEKFYAHRLAWALHYGEWPKSIIDHIDGNKTNNKIANLRQCSYSQNGFNRHNQTNNTSGMVGASFDKKRNKWLAKIMFNYKHIHIGYFSTKEEAHDAYMKKKMLLLSPTHHDKIS